LLKQVVDAGSGELGGGFGIDIGEFADGDHGTFAEDVAEGDVDFVGGTDELFDLLGGVLCG